MSSILAKNKSIFTLGTDSLKKTVNWDVDTKGFPDDMICPANKSNFLSKKEFLVYCVYDKSHRISNDKYSTHLTKCRRNYLVNLEKKGCPAEIAKCSINPDHWGYAPELAFHEFSCPDQFYLELEAVYFGKADHWLEAFMFIQSKARELAVMPMEAIDAFMKNFDDIKEDKCEHFAELYEYFIQLIKERPSTFQVKALRYKMLKVGGNMDKLGAEQDAVPVQRPKELFDQTKCPDSIGFIHRPLRYHRRYKLNKLVMSRIEEDPDDDQVWDFHDKPGKRGYSWLEMQFHLNPILRRCPPGLTRAERKEWERQGTERLMCEKGIFSTEELEAALENHKETEKLELEWNKME